jgi:hypothetical protein
MRIIPPDELDRYWLIEMSIKEKGFFVSRALGGTSILPDIKTIKFMIQGLKNLQKKGQKFINKYNKKQGS